MLLAKVWALIVGVWGWMWGNKVMAGYLVLALIIAFLTWRNNGLIQKNTILTEERGKLPDNIEFIAALKDTNFKVTYRDSKNNVIVKEYYVPREGGVTFTKYIDLKQYDPNSGFKGQSINPPTQNNPVSNFIDHILNPFKPKDPNADPNSPIKLDWYGLTFKPGIAAMYDGKFNAAIDFKLFYMNRYSMGLGSTPDSPYIWASRHVDDLVPFIKVENLEIMGGYGRSYSDFGHSVFAIGGRTNF